MNQSSDRDKIQLEFHALRDSLKTVQLATTDTAGNPEASYAPYVWMEQACYLYLSGLARHTTNLISNPVISLLFIKGEGETRNLFSRPRIILQGRVKKIDRGTCKFQTIMAEFKNRFGDFINIIEPLQDFHLFQVRPQSGRFIRGFAQAYELSGQGLDEIKHIEPQDLEAKN